MCCGKREKTPEMSALVTRWQEVEYAGIGVRHSLQASISMHTESHQGYWVRRTLFAFLGVIPQKTLFHNKPL